MGRRCSADSTAASERKTARARSVTRAGSAASSMSAAMAPWVRTTTSSPLTMARVHAMPPRMPSSIRRSQPGEVEPVQQAANLVDIGTGVDERAQGHVAGDPGEAVEPRDRRRSAVVGLVTGAAWRSHTRRRTRCRCPRP